MALKQTVQKLGPLLRRIDFADVLLYAGLFSLTAAAALLHVGLALLTFGVATFYLGLAAGRGAKK